MEMHTFGERTFTFNETQSARVVDAFHSYIKRLQTDLAAAKANDDEEDSAFLREALDDTHRLLHNFETAGFFKKTGG